MIKTGSKSTEDDEVAVLFNRDILAEYAAQTDAVLVRMFEFIRYSPPHFDGLHNPTPVELRKDEKGGVYYRHRIKQGCQSYSQGFQIMALPEPWNTVSQNDEKTYATFIAYDWKNDRVSEISCSPDALTDYYTRSALPFMTTPAFFRPEVLSKYKSDPKKYSLGERFISCHGTWDLRPYDINEAGQVHACLIYLSRLPYDEQLYWKSFNEHPKAPISDRAFTTDINGDFYLNYDPLESLKRELRELRYSWWTMRSEDAIERVHYPVMESYDEWKREIMELDKLLVEGFEKKWLRSKAKGLGRASDNQIGSLKLLEECLVGFGRDQDCARSIVSPLHEIHHLRSKLQAHASGRSAQNLKKKAIREYGSYREHYKCLVHACDETLKTLIEAFRESPG